MPRRPRRKFRRRSRDGYFAHVTNRYLRSPYDPENSRNFWGQVVVRTIANPPRSGAGRWFAWLIAVSFIGVAALMLALGAANDGITLLCIIVFGAVGVVLLLRLLSNPTR